MTDSQFFKLKAELELNILGIVGTGNKIQDYTNCFINNIEKTKAYSDKKVKHDVLSINGNKKRLSRLIRSYANEVVNKGINAASGGHIGYISGGSIYTSALADYLATVTNEYAGLFYASPREVTIENEILNWIKSLFRFPVGALLFYCAATFGTFILFFNFVCPR